MAQKPSTDEERDAKLAEAFANIERMQQNFNEVKQGYKDNIAEWCTQIQKYAEELKQDLKDNPNLKSTDDKKEYFDEPEVLQQNIKKLAALIRKSKHMVVFTGAGISTSCGIADFRSGVDTVLKTGAGKWAKRDAIKDGKWNKAVDDKHKKLQKNKTSTFKAIPSPSHMALIALAKAGYVKHLVSQNTDGLHRRSGFPIDQLSELHGNSFLEICPRCDKQYMRDFRCRQSTRVKSHLPRGYFSRLKYVIDHINADLKCNAYSLPDAAFEKMTKRVAKAQEIHRTRKVKFVANQQTVYDEVARETKSLMWDWEKVLNKHDRQVPRYLHHTGRLCTVKGCDGKLTDTIINFKEALPEETLETARCHSETADLYLVLGSSCAVYPAADMPEDVGIKWKQEMRENKEEEPVHNLCIVNIQKTPLHPVCSLPIHAKIDEVMIGVMKELGLEIPTWSLTRYLKLNVFDTMNVDKKRLCISGCDAVGTSYSQFKEVTLRQSGGLFGKKVIENLKNINNNHEDLEWNFLIDNWDKLSVELKFVGNYKEPNLIIGLNEYLDELAKSNGQIVVKMMMNPMTRKWIVPNKKEQAMDKNVKSLWFVGNNNDDDQSGDQKENDEQ